jgi:hypothetical protein
MPVFRVEKTQDYTTMANYHLKDKSLSLKAKGLLSLMLSLPDYWDYSLAGLAAICKDGKDCIRSTVNELEAHSYIKKNGRMRNDLGQLGDTEYTIYEKPMSDLPTLENPMLDNPTQDTPTLENPTQLSNKQLNTQVSNTDCINTASIFLGDEKEKMEIYRQVIYESIEYEFIAEQYNREQLDEIIEIMLECICSNADTIRIAQDDVPQELVKSRMLKINSEHIEYIFGCLKSNTTKVRNIKAYLKAVIYNAPVTISNYYSAEVNHDLYGG